MTNNSALLKQAKTTEVDVDHSTPTKGMGPRLPVEGKCLARLVGYVELGVHPQGEYKGKEKPPCLEVQLSFECFGKGNVDEVEIDGVTKKVGRILRPYPMAIKVNERASFYKLFKNMDYERGHKHMSHMLNDVFYVTVEHGESKNGNKYAKLASIQAPLREVMDDEGNITGTQDLTAKVPEASFDLQLFVTSKPTFEQWKSIEIEGTYTKKTKNETTGEEVEEEVSKNFIQEKIKSALDWDGCDMQTLLLSLDEDEPEEIEEVVVKQEPVKKQTVAKKDAPKKQSTATKDEPIAETASPSEVVDDSDDLLEELGL